ncbi:DNA primase small subunit [Trichinella sp. T8]|nr:DNA primase small subunit [Trichinella sp. T8]
MVTISTDEQGSIASTTGIDYDQTDDSLDRKVTFLPTSKPGRKTIINLERKRSRSAGRVEPSAPPLEEEDQYLCKKRSKDDLQIERAKPATIITKTTLTVPCSVISGMPEVKTTTTRRLSMNKSASEPHLLEFTPTLSAVHPNLLKSQPTLGQTPTTPKTPTGDSIPSRRHFFATKTVLKPENCDVCAKRIVFGKLILRCNDCKTQCHQECRTGAVVPCIARTPMARRAHGKLSDYVPPQGPFIPHVVVHCVNEIERRGIDAVGLYRVPGTETKIADLLAKFLSDRGVPNLKVIDDINVLTGCLKRFFHQLKEPLIPLTSKQDFINAAVLETDFLMQMKRIHSAVMELPYPNRDTLCFLIMHLQRVAEASASNKMPAENLAKIFGPTVLGVSDQCDQNVARMLDDASKAEKVMLILLSVPYGYWMQFLPVSQGQPLRSSSPVERSAMPATNAGGRFDSNRITSGATPGNGLRSRQTGMMKKDYYPPWHVVLFAQFTEDVISHWSFIQHENESLSKLNKQYEQEAEKQRTKVKELKAELIEARGPCREQAGFSFGKANTGKLMTICLFDDQIELVRRMLRDDRSYIPEKSRKKLEFLTVKSSVEERSVESAPSETGIDYDHTDDDSLDQKKPGRVVRTQNSDRKRSRSIGGEMTIDNDDDELQMHNSPKRSRDDLEIGFIESEKCPMKSTLNIPEAKRVGYRQSMNKSISEPYLMELRNLPMSTLQVMNPVLLKSQPTLAKTAVTSNTPTVDSIPSRTHFFTSKTVLKPEYCDVCEKRVTFGKLILRCNKCKTQCHHECRIGAVGLCVARTPMGRHAYRKLCDYVPPQAPFIPHIVVHCIDEIERRGVDVVGLYRVPGYVAALLCKIIDDINVLTGCLKKFFQQLKEPLIPLTSRQDFISAAMEVDELKKMDHVHQAIKELPYPNRDTLCFLVMHLQRVAGASAFNKMPKTNLAKIFGPTVLGFSDQQAQNVTQMIDDSSKSELVMQLLLSLPQQYWKQYLPVTEQERIAAARTTTTAPANPRIITATNVVDGEADHERLFPSTMALIVLIPICFLIMSTEKAAEEFEESYLHGMLPLYYRKLFPFKPYIKWLRYGSDDYFRRREFAFILKGSIYLRYKSFDNGSYFEKEVISSVPEKIDIGAVYNVEPKCKQNSETFLPVEKEMVFDIDLSDYDEIRECCKGGSICKICWHFIVAAIKVIDPILLDDFGFEHRLWVYSGRRGVHCWVADKEARNMNNEERSAVAEYISVVMGGEGQKKKVFLNDESVLHPVIQRGLVVASNIFPVLLKEYSWLDSQESWEAMLKLIPDKTIADALESIFEKVDTAEERWQAIKMALCKPHIPDNCRFAVSEILLQYIYPRLDMNVSKGINHLLKSPFCIHPKTGKVCVPIDLEKVDEFDPTSVPAIDDLLKELSENDAGEENNIDNEKKNRKPLDYNRTTLKPYVQIFERFVNSLPKEDIPQRDQSQMEF